MRKFLIKYAGSEIVGQLFVYISFVAGLLGFFVNDDPIRSIILCFVMIAAGLYIFGKYFVKDSDISDLVAHDWHSYHISYDLNTSDEKWFHGKISFDQNSNSNKITGSHEDKPQRQSYNIEGHVDGRCYLFVEYSKQKRRDNCFAYFDQTSNILKEGYILGYWMGPDQNHNFTIGPYIWSRKELNEDELIEISRNLNANVIGYRRNNDGVKNAN